ncbi:mechanosensitive ion channel family protein [Bacteriovorax sp. DB6_IX]|uniref:mechanosensitive ion channel family protein n=1 Tax=Bacteriovorax sp. DB6_IX TaxID=1353530 RepID=UPI00038A0E13|nr:mechanosensitive ion channel domain-containing protein [Bacteriovorax sp. DB6_IX]EQC51872.1 transporter, small conductance mechanosensitive ion channel MscS family protein [Bacteriovorax sp. DB6_IX]
METQNILELLKAFLAFCTKTLFELQGTKITLASIILGIFIFMTARYLSRISERLMHRFVSDRGLEIGVTTSIAKITRYFVLTIGIIITLDTLGVDMKSLAALGAVLGVGIGFGLQNITQNFISGIIILFERPVKIGDLVSVDGVNGRVVDIGSRSTRVLTRDDTAIIVPNSKFISDNVINQSFTGEIIRYNVNVGVAYGSDTKKVEQVMLEVAKNADGILKDPAPQVFFEDFGDSSLNFSLAVWVRELWHSKKNSF